MSRSLFCLQSAGGTICWKILLSVSEDTVYCRKIPSPAGMVWPVDGIFPFQRAHFYGEIAAGGIFKMPPGTLLWENRARWQHVSYSAGRGSQDKLPPALKSAQSLSGVCNPCQLGGILVRRGTLSQLRKAQDENVVHLFRSGQEKLFPGLAYQHCVLLPL